MLEYLRNASNKPVAKLLMGLLIFSFIGWGVAEWVFGASAGDTTLVNVGNAEIDIQQFNAEKSREMAQMSREEQRAIYADSVATEKFTNQVILKMASQQMANNRAADLGFVVSDHRIADEVRAFPEFQENGHFSSRLFDGVLMNSGYSEAQFANVLRGQILRSMVLGPVSIPTNVPKFVTMAMYNARYAERKIDYATVDYKNFKVGTPTDEDLRNFYAQNPHTVPESRSVSYVFVAGNMSVPDEYEKALSVAQSVEDDIIGGNALGEVAKKHNAKYVALKDVVADAQTKDDVMDAAMVSRAFSMDEGVESELMETKKGFVIMRVDKIIPAHNAEFEDVKKDLVALWKTDEQKKQAYARANEILIDLNQNGKMADKKSVTVSRTNGAPAAVLVGAFAGTVGANSIVPGDNAFYVLHIDSEILPKVDDKKMAQLNKEIAQTTSREMMDDYNAFLTREYPIKINEKVYNRYFKKQ